MKTPGLKLFIFLTLFWHLMLAQKNSGNISTTLYSSGQHTQKSQENSFRINHVGLDLQANSQINFWFLSQDDDNEEGVGHAIDYEIEGVQTWQAQGVLLINKTPTIGILYKKPFTGDPVQTEIIVPTLENFKSLKQYAYFFQTVFLTRHMNAGLVKTLLSWRFDYDKSTFFGKGIAVEPTVFYPRAGVETLLELEDSFRFKTTFTDWMLTVPIGNLGFRVGYYSSRINKPYETRLYDPAYPEATIVTEIQQNAAGAVFTIQNSVLDFRIRLGEVEFKSLGNLKSVDPFKNDGGFDFYMLMRCKLPMQLWSHGRHQRFFLEPVAGFVFRANYLETSDIHPSIEADEGAMDITIDLGLSARLVF